MSSSLNGGKSTFLLEVAKPKAGYLRYSESTTKCDKLLFNVGYRSISVPVSAQGRVDEAIIIFIFKRAEVVLARSWGLKGSLWE